MLARRILLPSNNKKREGYQSFSFFSLLWSFPSPAEGDSFAAEDTLCDIESVKAVSDILCPVGGTVTEVNEELMDAPEKINQDAYGAWLVKVSGVEGADALMSAAEYEEFLKEA